MVSKLFFVQTLSIYSFLTESKWPMMLFSQADTDPLAYKYPSR